MQQYLDVVERVLNEGTLKTDIQTAGQEDSDESGNLVVIGEKMEYDLRDGFPFLNARDMRGSWKALRAELLWILQGDTTIAGLHRYGVKLWDQWASDEICAKMGFPRGELGPIYGHLWRNYGATKLRPGQFAKDGFDQVTACINRLRADPDRRRAVIMAWDPTQVGEEDVFVAPCPIGYHFVSDGQGGLGMTLWQRSADVPIGVPFNTAEAALLLMMVAQVVGLQPTKLVHFLSDVHIYRNQIPFMEQLLERRNDPLPLPTVTLNPSVSNIFDFTMDDFELHDYVAHPAISGIPVAV